MKIIKKGISDQYYVYCTGKELLKHVVKENFLLEDLCDESKNLKAVFDFELVPTKIDFKESIIDPELLEAPEDVEIPVQSFTVFVNQSIYQETIDCIDPEIFYMLEIKDSKSNNYFFLENALMWDNYELGNIELNLNALDLFETELKEAGLWGIISTNGIIENWIDKYIELGFYDTILNTGRK